ncbi:hypothetical protein MCGE09_00486, partial [Thaumarchaeota archaeon SCGC AB-539-E09]
MSIIALRDLTLLKAFAICASLSPDTILLAFDVDTPSETILVTRSFTLLFGINDTKQIKYIKTRTHVQNEVQVEGIMCPNCKEEVPKTLYCLNCGYPLYKISMDADKPEEEDSIPVVKEKVEIDEGVAIVVDSFEAPVVEEVAFEPIEEPAAVIELPAPFIVEESPAVEVEPSEATVEAIEVSEKLEVEEEEPVGTIEFSEPTEIFVEAAESNEPEEIIEAEEPEEIIEAEEPEEIIEAEEPEEKAAVEEKVVVKEEAVIEMEYVFEPEPVTREVMENLAKNVSLKIKLVDLLLKGEVKMVTFERLFDNYVARSKLLLNSRSEMLVRVRFDLESR